MRTKSATPEEVWAAIKELTQAQKETEKARREGERSLREAQQRTEEAQQRTEEARREGERSLREAQKETEEARREGERLLRESQRETEEGFRQLQEAQKETEKARREGEKVLREALQDLTKNLNEASGNFNNKWGKFLESLVKGDLIHLLAERNIQVDAVRSRLIAYGPDMREVGEFDLVALNGQELVVVEVKTTLTKEKVRKSIEQLRMFREYFPGFRDRLIYGGVAFLCEPETREARTAAEYAEEEGLFVILSPGGNAKVSTLSNAKDFRPRAF